MSDTFITQLETRHGPMLALRGDRYITRSLELYGEFSRQEWALLEQLVRPGMTVVEAGANIGSHTVSLARRCAPGLLYAFEPQQQVFQILCANLALNGVRNAVALPEACGEAEGRVVIPPLDYAAEGNFGGVSVSEDRPDARGLRARVRPIDDLELPACGLIKVDVEGFEPAVLRGARETIARCRPLLYVENDRAAQQGEVISLMASMGYRLYWHTPPLFSADNFRGNAENVFKGIVSLNVLGIPAESPKAVHGSDEIDPDNWQSPIRTG